MLQHKFLSFQRELAERLANQSQHGTGRSQGSAGGGASAAGSAPRPAHRSSSYQSAGSNERQSSQSIEAQYPMYGASDGPPPSQSAGDGRRPGYSSDFDRHADTNLHISGSPGEGFSSSHRDNHQPAVPQRPTGNASNNASSSSSVAAAAGIPNRLPRTSAAAPQQQQASARQAKIPINLPNRMMHNTDIDMRQQHAALTVRTDIPAAARDMGGGGQSPPGGDTPPPPRRDMYAERPAGRGGYSPSRDRGLFCIALLLLM